VIELRPALRLFAGAMYKRTLFATHANKAPSRLSTRAVGVSLQLGLAEKD